MNREIRSKCIGLIEKIYSKRKERLLQKQQLEGEEFSNFRECEKDKQQKAHEELVDFISAMDLSFEVKKEKLNLLKQEFSNRMEKFEEHMKGQRRKLVVMQIEARNKEQQMLKCWLAEANAGRLAESLDKVPLADTGFTPDEFRNVEQLGACDGLRNALSMCGEYESTCSVVDGRSDSIDQDNAPTDVLLPTSRETVEGLLGVGMVTLPDTQAVENNTEPVCAPTSTSFEIQGPSTLVQALSSCDKDYSLPSNLGVGMVTLPDTQAVEDNAESECAQMPTSSEIQGPSPAAQALSNCDEDCSLPPDQRVGMNTLHDREAVDNNTEPECAQMSISSEVQGTSLVAQALSNCDEDYSLPSNQRVEMVILPDTRAVDNNTEPDCGPMSTSFEIQGPSPVAQALSGHLPSHEVPSNPHEGPPLLNGFDSGQGLNSSQTVTAVTSQSSDSLPVQLRPSDDLMVCDSVPILPEVCSDFPPVQQVISCTSGATESVQELSSSRVMTDPSTQGVDEHSTDANYSTNSVQESSGSRVNSQATILDGLETGQRMNSLDGNAFTGSDETSRLITLQTEPSDQPIEQNTVLNGVNAVVEKNSSQNPSQEIIDSSLQSQATADLSSGQCDIAHAGTPGGHRYDVTGDTCCPTDLVQISAQQSFGLIASHTGHSDIACTGWQELNSSHDTSLQMPSTADATSNASHANPSAHQVQWPPVRSFGTSSQSGQTIVGMHRGRMENPTSTTEESNNHLRQPLLVVHQPSLHDPLQNELNKIRKEEDRDAEMCKKEKQRLKLELEKEIEQVRKKYDSLFHDVETKFVERKKTFATLYKKVFLSRVLAEEFRLKFAESKALSTGASSQGTDPSFVQQVVHASQPQVAAAHREALPSAAAAMPLVSLGHVPASAAVPRFDIALSSARARLPAPVISPVSSSSGPAVQVVHHSSALFSSNPPVRHMSPALSPRANFLAGSGRAPAPHLHPFRTNASMSMPNFALRPRGSPNQQQLPSHSMSSMPPQVVNTPLSFPRRDAISGTRRQEDLSVRPVLSAPQSIPREAADVRKEGAGRSVPNAPPSPKLNQGCPGHASTASGQPTSSSDALAGTPDVVCLPD